MFWADFKSLNYCLPKLLNKAETRLFGTVYFDPLHTVSHSRFCLVFIMLEKIILRFLPRVGETFFFATFSRQSEAVLFRVCRGFGGSIYFIIYAEKAGTAAIEQTKNKRRANL